MNSRLAPACAIIDNLADTPPAWSATSPDQTCTRSSLKPMAFILPGRDGGTAGLYRGEAAGRKENPKNLASRAASEKPFAAGGGFRHNDQRRPLHNEQHIATASGIAEVVSMKRCFLAAAVVLTWAAGMASADYIVLIANVGQSKDKPAAAPNQIGIPPGSNI